MFLSKRPSKKIVRYNYERYEILELPKKAEVKKEHEKSGLLDNFKNIFNLSGAKQKEFSHIKRIFMDPQGFHCILLNEDNYVFYINHK